MYHELIYHLDLCILSYHLYAQTLAWPMDPYYEQMARVGTDRRTNFMKEVRKIQTSLKKNFPDNLDPILFDYDRIDPRKPCFVSSEVSKWDVFNAPRQITDSIRDAYMVTMDKKIKKIPNQLPPPQGVGGQRLDDLYCFEGVTGRVKSKRGLLSMMGFVLTRKLQPGEGGGPNDYDVHIVFRGSRSGSAVRAATEAVSEKGNPDWVTDMDFNKVLSVPTISSIGSCCRGFSTSVTEFIPVILMCLKDIATKREDRPPRRIYVTGHSLGGALAAHFASAMILGVYKDEGFRKLYKIERWPWSELRLITFGAPTVGGDNFHKAFNAKIFARRVLLGGHLSKDPITQGARNYHVGSRIYIPATQLLPKLLMAATEYHEPYLIRREFIKLVKGTWKEPLANVPANTGAAHTDEPWKKYKNFASVLEHPQLSGNNQLNIMGVLGGDYFRNNLVRYLKILKEVVSMNSSYKTLTLASTKQNKQQTIEGIISDIHNNTSPISARALEQYFDEATFHFVGLCLILYRLAYDSDYAEEPPFGQITQLGRKIINKL